MRYCDDLYSTVAGSIEVFIEWSPYGRVAQWSRHLLYSISSQRIAGSNPATVNLFVTNYYSLLLDQNPFYTCAFLLQAHIIQQAIVCHLKYMLRQARGLEA